MGTVLKIPGYVYFDTQNFYQKLILYVSDDLYNKLQSGQIIRKTYSGAILSGNIKQLINNELGENVFTNSLEPVITLKTGESVSLVGSVVDAFGLSYQTLTPSNGDNKPTKFETLNSFTINNTGSDYQLFNISAGLINASNYLFNFGVAGFSDDNVIRVFGSGFNEFTLQLKIPVFPSSIFVGNQYNPQWNSEIQGSNITTLQCSVIYSYNTITGTLTPTFASIDTTVTPKNRLTSILNNFVTDYAMIQEDDTENPYTSGDNDNNSWTGGGDGNYGDIDGIDPTDFPDLPSLSAAATGFITMYNPSSSNLSALGNFLWSGQFDLDTYKKLFADPMEGIIGLGIVPVLPASAGARNIYFGNVDSGINCSVLASQYATKDCGSVSIEKNVGSFLDYSPYVKVSLFLPYIGFVNLGTDDLMGGSINVKYNVDVLSGDCVAFIKHSQKGVLYAYNGNCLTNVPVSGQNYANALRNYYESVAGVIPATTNGAVGGPAGAVGGALTGTLSAASNIILNSKPTFQRSGNIGGSAGLMGIQTPFVIIERPRISVPSAIQHYAGQTSNITMSLGSCVGMTVVEHVHLNGIHATSEELREIETILKGGVIL